MSNPIEIKKIKLNTLNDLFSQLGYQTSTKLGQNEFRLFLNKQSKIGRFEPVLTEKLFEVLDLDENSTITIEEFITGFLEFEEDVKKNAELFQIKLAQEQEIYDKIVKQCNIYQSEKLNAEGFCENAKIFGEITDIDIKKKLEGIKEIIIIVIYNEKKEELLFKIGDNSNEMLKKSFNFKPISRKDHFEFIMKGVNERNQIFDIGSKIFPLYDIISQEEYLIQIVIPEIENPNQIAAFITAKIILYMSDFKYYESLRKKQEKRLKKFMVAANKAADYLKYVREIYGDLSLMKSDLIVDFNNEKLMQRKGAKLNVKFKNELEGQGPENNYFVEFNNEREVLTKGTPLRIKINNSKEFINPLTESRKYRHQYSYSSIINNNTINDIERKIQKLKNEKENINKNIQNIPKPNLEQYATTNIKIIKTQEIQNIRQNIPEQPIIQNINPEQFSNENIIQTKINNSQQRIMLPPKPESTFSHKYQKIQQTITEENTQNNIKPEYIINQTNYGNNGMKFDVDSYLKQKTTQIQTQTQIQNPPILPTNISQNTNSNPGEFIPNGLETTNNITNSPFYPQYHLQNNNFDSGIFIQERIDTTNNINTPVYSQNQFQNNNHNSNLFNKKEEEINNKIITTPNLEQNQSHNNIIYTDEYIQNKKETINRTIENKTQNNNLNSGEYNQKVIETTKNITNIPIYAQTQPENNNPNYETEKTKNITNIPFYTQTQLQNNNYNQNIFIQKEVETTKKINNTPIIEQPQAQNNNFNSNLFIQKEIETTENINNTTQTQNNNFNSGVFIQKEIETAKNINKIPILTQPQIENNNLNSNILIQKEIETTKNINNTPILEQPPIQNNNFNSNVFIQKEIETTNNNTPILVQNQFQNNNLNSNIIIQKK